MPTRRSFLKTAALSAVAASTARIAGAEIVDAGLVMPALKMNDFAFTSLSDAV